MSRYRLMEKIADVLGYLTIALIFVGWGYCVLQLLGVVPLPFSTVP